MKYTFHILFLLFLTACNTVSTEVILVQESNKFGFINEAGEVVIPIQYRSAHQFSEGLSAVRKEGKYGFINTEGEVVIPFEFDVANSFSSGLALVNKNREEFYIDKSGNEVFRIEGVWPFSFNNGLARFRTKTGKEGIVNTEGDIIVDTIYKHVQAFKGGYVVVSDSRVVDGENENTDGVIDSTGQFVVPLGKYSSISDYQEGHFVFNRPSKHEDSYGIQGILDESGNELFQMNTDVYYLSDRISDGLITGYIHSTTEDAGGYRNCFFNLDGKVEILDSSFKYIDEFACNRAIITNHDRMHYVIDRKGNRINDVVYEFVDNNGFVDNVLAVNENYKWGVIDTNGHYIVHPNFYDIEFCDAKNKVLGFRYEYKVGLANFEGKTLIEPTFNELYQNKYLNNVLYGTRENQLVVLHKSGKIIWEEKQDSSIQFQNIDFRSISDFPASSIPHKDDLGGYAHYVNLPKPLKGDKYQSNGLILEIDTTIFDTIYHKYWAHPLKLINSTDTAVLISAQDSRIEIMIEAINETGEWESIQYIPRSWCGNSYHTLTLDGMHYWDFKIPVYEGDFQTKMRVCFYDSDTSICSESYTGSINKSQFFNYGSSSSSNLMSPY